MKIITPPKHIEVRESSIKGAGRGVFAAQAIKKGQIIEESPVLFLEGEARLLKSSELYNYYYLSEDKQSAAIAFGYGSMYNHSYEPNATYEKQFESGLIIFVALKDIAANEEITVNYNYGDPDDKSPLWIPSIEPYQT